MMLGRAVMSAFPAAAYRGLPLPLLTPPAFFYNVQSLLFLASRRAFLGIPTCKCKPIRQAW